ncbi:Fungal specific transcription factor domain-containing protein isoform 3 [Cladophialophora immunda]|nr:Fungal specific transcription factor domain-containing protein isoform 2 [Cladophialophora immunda]OQV00167.1 Fungal specific transcription factor domain-containing protein isoform 3 [Cladophialophora immunda]
MFGIYCTSLLSLAAEDCQRQLGASKEDLLIRYQHGCQQALLNCSFLRTNDRECLTALYLYLISIRPNTVPQSLSSMLAVAIRIAQRMGIHSESALTRHTTLEAEMRRRLWWSLVLFDSRISETSNSKPITLDPTWDCRVPLNVNDSDLRPETKKPPAMQGNTTEALFAVVRCELGEVVRHSSFHLDFTTPALKTNTDPPRGRFEGDGTELAKLEEIIEDQYLQHCDPEHPLHFMTIWTARSHLAKYRLLEHHSRCSSSSARQTDAQRDTATSHALRVLECDTKAMGSPLTKGFRWLNHLYFPFPAYIQIVQDLRSRPTGKQAGPAWEAMSDNYDAWFGHQFREDSPFFRLFTKLILQAWEACEAASGFEQSDDILVLPRVVSSVRNSLAQMAPHARNADTDPPPSVFTGPEIDEHPMPTSTITPTRLGFPNQSPLYSNGMQDAFSLFGPQMDIIVPGQEALGGHVRHWDWTGLGGQPGWEGF